tara:strand:+ start:3338 stop:6607 length:3270 start_codon:yes stop_codon:yes gene_type:complete
MASNPTLTFKEGDRINLNVDEATGHPFYIKTTDTTGSGDQVSGVTNNGTVDGMVIWQTQGGDAGTYYYKCGNHAAMGGTIVIQSSAPLPGYNIDVTAADNDDYTLQGKDSTGNISGDDIDVTIYEGNRVNFLVDAAGHPFYIKSTAGSGTGNQVSGVTGQGLESGTTYWIPPIGSAGTYYYQCGNHTAMSGKLIVLGSNTPGNPSYSSKTSNGGPLTLHTSAFLDIEKAGPYFTGSVPIKFSDMRRFFKEKTTGSVSAKELKRNTNDLERDPIVSDSTENSAIADTISYDWKTSQFRGSIKRYYATTNQNNIEMLSMGRFTGANGADWSNGGTQGADSINQLDGNVARNVQKHIYIDKIVYSGNQGTDGFYGSGGGGKDKTPAARLIPSEPNNAAVPAHNVRIYVEDSGAIYGSSGLGGWHQNGGYSGGSPKPSDPGKDGGVALKILHTGSQTDIYLQNDAKVWGGGGGGEQGTMGELIGSSMEDMKHDCVNNYVVNSDCGQEPSCNAGDTLVPGSVEETGPCGPEGSQQTKTGVCQSIVKSTEPVQGIGGRGGDGAGWNYRPPYVGGAPQEETEGGDGTEPECGVCPPGTNLQGGNCSSSGGKGGKGGDWGKDGQDTAPLDGVPQDGGKGGAAICGLNPDTGAKNWVIGGTISDSTLKGKYTGDCVGGGAPIPPVPSPATVTVSKPHYVRFGDDAGNGTDGYGADGAANLLVTAPSGSAAGNICRFRMKYTWNDREGLGTHMSGMQVAGRIFKLPSKTWYLSYNNPYKSPGMENNWSQYMKDYAIFPGDYSYFAYNPAHSGPYYPHLTLADEVHTLRYRFTISNNTQGFRLISQADNQATFAMGRVGNPTIQIGLVPEFSNPAEGGDILDVTFPSNDSRFAPGEYNLDVTIKNSKFPAGQEPVPGANDDWAYNPGGVAFVLLNLDSDNWDDRGDSDPGYMISSKKTANLRYERTGSTIQDFDLPQGAYPIEWGGLNPRNVDAGNNYPNASRMQFQQGKEIQLLDDDSMDANGKFEILHETTDTIYPGADLNWSTDAGNTLTATSTPNDPTFQFAGKTGSDSVEPMASTKYRFTAIGPGGSDIEERTIM